MRFVAAALLAALAAPLRAQTDAPPPPAAVVEAWQRAWAEAAAGVVAIDMAERSERTLAGPRGTVRIETAGRLRYAPGVRAERTLAAATVNGRAVAPSRVGDLDGRHARALGPAGGALLRPPPSPDGFLARARALDVRAERLDDAPAWRVALATDRPPPGRRRRRRGPEPPPGPSGATAWFSPSVTSPRLLRLDLDGADGGRYQVTYVRVGGLDLPAAVHAEATIRQQRRLRDFAVSLVVSARFADHTVTRRP